ncbi:nitrate reductase molybdenum cofactor assembly chaperone [Arachnia propionica]|uniref:Nitrate reductase molybdenum cofactor assembly chaperone n=1 Tax=Arachnia propionica TaxID=1750 RepID=A0A3P1T2G4_9ACTN|nr:nitrate reductase molybdenum cofactor assembly chaperone [Arachnia propionica]RRD03475.1 nitrate reductase molybdenum cofactor assembly chaperone [Arachnia propionica]
MESTVVFSAAALLLSYPDEELLSRLDAIEEAVATTGVAELFAPTIAHLRSSSLMEAQSFHVQEFDLSRRHALHLTYWTDGDTRRRGEALLHFKQVYRSSGLLVDLAGELPDHLPVVLEFAAVADPGSGRRLLEEYRVSLELLRIGLVEDGLPQAGVVQAVCQMLGGTSPQTRAEVAKLLEGPPTETVGMGADLLPYPQFLGH